MIEDGQVVLFTFARTNGTGGRLRPALVLRATPGPHNDWLICMISTSLHQEVPGVDEVIRDSDPDFAQTGLKTTSVARVIRLAVVSSDLLHGRIGQLGGERLARVRGRLAEWISGGQAAAT